MTDISKSIYIFIIFHPANLSYYNTYDAKHIRSTKLKKDQLILITEKFNIFERDGIYLSHNKSASKMVKSHFGYNGEGICTKCGLCIEDIILFNLSENDGMVKSIII